MKKDRKSIVIWAVTAAVILILAVSLLLFARYGLFSSSPAIDGSSITVALSVTTDGSNVLYSDKVAASEGDSLISIAEQNITGSGGIVYTNGEYGAYITSICGQSEDPGSSRYWVFTVNGETPMVGASDYCPSDGDVIVFDLSELHW